MAIRHGVIDVDKHFVIDPVTRTIKNESGKLVLIQYDHNSERFTFECPRYIDEHDMSLCNRVEVHYINTGTGNSRSTGVYEIDDLQIPADNENVVTCSWLVSQNATQHVGKLNFIMRFACVAEDSTIEYAWNTSIYSDIVVSKSIYNGEEFIENYVDVLEMWKQDLYSEGLKITSIEQTTTSTEANGINVITITMTDGSQKTFTIQNGPGGPQGVSISDVDLIDGDHSPGTLDTYQIGFTDETKALFQVYNGANGEAGSYISEIARTSGDGSPGTVDTYTITLTNGDTFTFQVYNGANGSDGDGSGDMSANTYDPQGKRTDIFKYVDNAITDKIPSISDSVTTESSETVASSAAVKIAYDKAVEALETAETSGDDNFYATYGTTTNAEIEAAYQAGKKIYCLTANGGVCPLYEHYSATMHCFYKGASYFYCNNNTWTEEDCPYEGITNKVTSITEGSTDEQYPSAKAVYTLINESINGAIEGSY